MRKNKGSEYDGMVLHSIFLKVLIRMGKIGKIIKVLGEGGLWALYL